LSIERSAKRRAVRADAKCAACGKQVGERQRGTGNHAGNGLIAKESVTDSRDAQESADVPD
jgi:hypothetical protein